MKRFAIFEYRDYYPNGGMDDYSNSFDSLMDAIDFCRKDLGLDGKKLERIVKECSYTCEIWDMEEIKIVWSIYEEEVGRTVQSDRL